ncbi:RagB/SusD family nutrient uptake outer membrane protein [Echinicola strongylocentroti]|uniref:RagB/SusD family nutrient uptake outer membrane protein n=1 Tax=Echinicola strongylocentroti TaxID=1795355 RepID=A0A2Z4IKX2_9BACT|nr:RagB/SusD family nutrient uptake outer membrane protein [Echinicola strongylocentroti]AWW31595.1 RagB/SusD family nutrient uptake outer membrane protein [Echinicola strongylocentroti]
MKYSKIYIMAGLMALIVGLGSCDVNRLPETQLSDPAFWRNENDLKLAANYLYTYLPALPVTSDVWSDDAFGKSPNTVSDGTRIAPATDGNYNNAYFLIRAANNIIEKAPRALESGVDPAVVDRYVAEAKFFRAWAYFRLVKRYGDVPLIGTTLAENSEELFAPAAPRAEVLALIYEDLDEGTANLPAPSELDGADYGRITNTAAWAFKSRVALFEGTRSKYHGYGDPQMHLTLAKEAAEACMNSGEHDLFGSYFDLYQYEGEGPGNKENILVRQYGVNVSESITSHTAQRTLETGASNPTKSLADAYLMVDGLPMDKSPLYSEPQSILEVFDNRDPRMSDTFYKEGDEYIGTQPVFNVPNLSFVRTGFANRRYANITDWQNSRSYIDYTIIRYAEVLLNYAEAVYELNGSITDEELDNSVNLLRQRAGVSELSNAFASANGLEMLQEIRRERRVELALEGFRYWDLIRWKTAEEVMPQAVLGNYYFEEYGTEVTPNLTEDNIILLQAEENRSFDPDRDYLWPLPINELGLNPALEQNPNW